MAAQPHEVEVTIYDGPTVLVTRMCRLVQLRDGQFRRSLARSCVSGVVGRPD